LTIATAFIEFTIVDDEKGGRLCVSLDLLSKSLFALL